MTDSEFALEQVLSAPVFALQPDFFRNKQIVFYGAGRLGQMSAQILSGQADIAIDCYVDRNYLSINEIDGIAVRSVDYLNTLEADNTIVVISAFKLPFNEMTALIRCYTQAPIYTVYELMYCLPATYFSNGWYAGELSALDKQAIRAVHAGFNDDASQALYRDLLLWRISRQEHPAFAQHIIDEKDKYFNELTHSAMTADGVWIDGGAFDLGVSLQALQHYPDAEVIAFEPDPAAFKNCKQILNSTAAKTQPKLTSLALSDKTTELPFAADHGLASRLVHDEAELAQVPTVSIDSYLAESESGKAVAVIKLHIEGEELAALRGAEQTIRQYRPLLMVNCSHNREGLWAIQQYCMQWSGYQFYLRSHAFYGEGVTFYAIPQEVKPA